MKEKLRVGLMVLLVLTLLAMAGGFWTFVGVQAEKEKAAELVKNAGQAEEEGGIEAMFIPVGTQGDSWMFADENGLFEAEIPEGELYNEAGDKITAEELYTGDVLKIYGNIISTRSLPPQYSGIEKMIRIRRGTVEDAAPYSTEIQKYTGKPICAKEREDRSLLEEKK